jgi:hypothetical protein
LFSASVITSVTPNRPAYRNNTRVGYYMVTLEYSRYILSMDIITTKRTLEL